MEQSLDPYAPREMAARVRAAGVAKAELPVLQTTMLGVLAGVFIAFGAMLFTLVLTDSQLGLGVTRLVAGISFSLGLVLVVIGGAELFTGNNLLVMAWADGSLSSRALLRNWGIVYLANAFGALAATVAMWAAGALDVNVQPAAQTAVAIADGKLAIGASEAFVRGILCNVLVCLAVWLSYAARSVSGKVLAVVFPVTAFVALGFEHSIANMYLLPAGMLAASGSIDLIAIARNLVPVTAGNIVGGGLLVAAVYWVIYLRGQGPGPIP